MAPPSAKLIANAPASHIASPAAAPGTQVGPGPGSETDPRRPYGGSREPVKRPPVERIARRAPPLMPGQQKTGPDAEVLSIGPVK